MKRIPALFCTGILAVSCSFAQTTPPVIGAATPAQRGASAGRPARVLSPQQKADSIALAADHQNMMDQLHITSLRPGKSGTSGQPNYANYDEAKANPFPNLPDPLVENNGKKVTIAKEWWNKRRPEIVEGFDREIYGRVPKNVPKVTWSVASTTNETVNDIPVITKKLIGHVDNSSYPAISVNIELTLTTPANATGPVPVIMVLGGGGFGPPRAAPAAGAATATAIPAK